MLDMMTLLVLLPILFYLQPALSWIVLLCAGLIAGIIVAFMRPMSRRVERWIDAETAKSSVHGGDPARHPHGQVAGAGAAAARRWDERVAEADPGEAGRRPDRQLPQMLINPIEGFMQRGVLLVGAYIALPDTGNVAVGGLVAFMMLSGRVAQPLAGLAKLMEDIGEVRAAIGLAASVLNQRRSRPIRPPACGRASRARSLRRGHLQLPGANTPALDRSASASRPAPCWAWSAAAARASPPSPGCCRASPATTRASSSIDGIDLREINLAHLRRNFGVVLQENFLFRGTMRDNIIAGRPGLTLEDAVRAARLAGAEEFIERLPNGYETMIEEGSPNLSGGQRQRLAIARALIHDPRILILDEATSALDPESEALVNANLASMAQGRTMVIVSHRLSSLAECDQILVLDRARVLDIGPHSDLLERCPIYRQLWHQQNRHMMDRQGPPQNIVPAQGV